jgi:acyl-CoA synthetase (AMP-forming)/AMP-acid ligase II
MKRALGKMVVGNILANAALRYPDAPAFYCASTGRRFTFRETDERTNRLAQALLGQGLQKGDVVALLLSNRAEIVEVFFALARTGIIGLPLNYRLAASEMVELMRSMGATALVYEGRFAGEAQAVHRTLPGVARIIRIASPATDFGRDYEELLQAASPRPPEAEVGEDDPYYYNLTSGTTGVPKAYMLTHYNNCATGFIFPEFDLTRRDVVMTVFPIFGRVGFAWVIASVLYGIPNVLANFEPREVLRLIATERVTIVNLVPTMAAMLLQASAAAADLSALRAIVFAGAVLPPTIREQTRKSLCPDIYEYYGMNEMGSLFISTPADRARRPDSVGRPTMFSEARIVGDDGHDLAPNQIGEILGRSPMSVTSYFESPIKSAETFRGGWLHTGDLGYRDEEGYLYIRGRKKDMIITGGQNVYSAELEDVILRCAGVAECAVIGLPDELWGERVTAVVVPRPDSGLTAAQLDAFCRRYLAGFKIPKEFVIYQESLPRTSNGKVQKFMLVERLSGREVA